MRAYLGQDERFLGGERHQWVDQRHLHESDLYLRPSNRSSFIIEWHPNARYIGAWLERDLRRFIKPTIKRDETLRQEQETSVKLHQTIDELSLLQPMDARRSMVCCGGSAIKHPLPLLLPPIASQILIRQVRRKNQSMGVIAQGGSSHNPTND